MPCEKVGGNLLYNPTILEEISMIIERVQVGFPSGFKEEV